jgi:outer membrane protein TolC
LQKKYEEIENQINLQIIIAVGNLESSLRTEQANKSSLVSAEEYYKAISSQYALGQKSLLDLLDARNQLTGSQISFHVAHFETLIRYAELERAKASIDLGLYTNK